MKLNNQNVFEKNVRKFPSQRSLKPEEKGGLEGLWSSNMY